MTSARKKVTREGVETLPPNFGSDRGRSLIITIDGRGEETLIKLRPKGARNRTEVLRVVDVYHYAIKCRANRATLEKAREKKEKRRIQREQRAIKQAEKRLLRK